MIDLTINKTGLQHNIEKAKENHVIIPTIAQMQNPDLIPEKVKAKLTGPVAERFFDTGALCALLDAHRAGKTNAMTKLWAFYCFIEWYEVYFTGKIPPDL